MMSARGEGWKVLSAMMFAVFCASVRPASATDVAVSCPGASLQAAINALDLIGPHLIQVDGTCHESIVISNRDRIRIEGNPTAIIEAASPGGDAILVLGSHNIVLASLTLTGSAFHGLYLGSGSTVLANDIRAHDNGRGIEITDNSFFSGINVTSDHNFVSGFRLHNSTMVLLAATIEDNSGGGIVADASQMRVSNSSSIRHNGSGGISLFDSSSAIFDDVNVEGNTGFGARINSASSMTIVASTVKLNTGGGIDVQEAGHATLRDSTVSFNGGTTPGGGIHAGSNGNLSIEGSLLVTDNTGTGIEAEFGAVLSSLGSNTISRNSGDGVLVRRIGAAHFLAPDTITGNGGASVACDNTSLVVGDLSSLTRVRCSRVTP